MSLDAGEIALILKREGSGVSPEDYDETSQPEDVLERRIGVLQEIKTACVQAFRNGIGNIESMAEKLGDGSRDMAWRIPYGESGILAFFLEVLLTPGISHKLKVHSLRIVGNSCADTDVNRARLVDGNDVVNIINLLQDESLLQFTIPVLFNVLVDYEPAQLLASKSRLNNRLMDLLDSKNIEKYAHLVPYMCKILALLITQDGEPAVANPDTVRVLLNRAIDPLFADDVDDFTSLVSVAVAYLANEKFQAAAISSSQIGLFLDVFYRSHTHFDIADLDDADSAASLKHLRASILTSLADITGNDAFGAQHPLSSKVTQTLLEWLRGSNHQLRAAACLALGNLSRSDEISTALIKDQNAHFHLIKDLSDPSISDPQQLHSALSFLKNLAIPNQNKPLLGELLEPSCLPRILAFDTQPQVQFAAISLTRLLLVNCPDNAHRVCKPRSSLDGPETLTTVQDILSLFGRSDAEPTKLEAARSIAALCRVLHSTSPLSVLLEWNSAEDGQQEESILTSEEGVRNREKESKTRSLFYKENDLSKALSFLVAQQKWPILRSEAWFVFALMSRSTDGAEVVLNILSAREAADALVHSITGQKPAQDGAEEDKKLEAATSNPETEAAALTQGLGLEPQQVDPKQKSNMAKIDRENCLVLCTEVIKNQVANMPPARLALLEDLIRQGTDLISTGKD